MDLMLKNIKNNEILPYKPIKKVSLPTKKIFKIMEGNTFFTPQEHEQLITLYKRLLQLSKDTLQKDDCRKLKAHLVNAMQGGSIPRNVFGMNPIIKDMQTAMIVAEEIGMRRASILGIMLHESVKYGLCTLESVEREYGSDVAGIISGLVRINDLYAKSPTIEDHRIGKLPEPAPLVCRRHACHPDYHSRPCEPDAADQGQ